MKATVLHGDCTSLLDQQKLLLGMAISPFSIHPLIKIKVTTSGLLTCRKRSVGKWLGEV